MKLSIIIRTYQRLEYTIRTIVSVDEKCGLSKDDYEIICVDQNSTDGTREWLKQVKLDGYYPVRPVFLEENIGDGRGLQVGIDIANGDYIAQLDSDIELVTPDYFSKLIQIYEQLEIFGLKVCAVGGSHKQGFNKISTPMRFGKERYPQGSDLFPITFSDSNFSTKKYLRIFYSAWVTGAFIFRKEFTSHPFGKGMCNEFCSYFWDNGYDNFLCEDIKFYHIDSGETGAHIQKQYDKFPNYSYAFRHYSKFIKRK